MSSSLENCKLDPIQSWKNRLLQNNLPNEMVDQLENMAREWLDQLQQDQDLTPAEAFEKIESKYADKKLLDYFTRYKFALFALVKASDLTKQK